MADDLPSMNECRWCNGDHGDWGCTICQSTNSERLENPLLCQACQSWDDFTHVVFCQDANYTRLDPSLFGDHDLWSSDPMMGVTLTEFEQGYFDKTLSDLEFRTSKVYSDMNPCILCALIGNIINHGDNDLQSDKVAVWRPFPYPMTKPSYRSRGHKNKNGEAQGLTAKCILPICLLRNSENGSATSYRTMNLEIELYYNSWGQGLQQVKQWDRRFCNTTNLLAWLSRCQDSHGDYCAKPQTGTHCPPDFRIIDIRLGCLLQPEQEAEFVALSYQWSTATAFEDRNLKLTRANMKELSQPGALKIELIPEVIVDAMQLCHDIGSRYLWVDRLCVVQDDDSLKQPQIQAMDSIYQMAMVTIVACSDRLGAGLPGISTRPRQSFLQGREWKLDIGEHYVGASPASITENVDGSRWNTRGWTFQERTLSRRLIYFCQNHVYAECQEDTAEELEREVAKKQKSNLLRDHSTHGRGPTRVSRFLHLDLKDQSQDILFAYNSLVSKYRNRTLGDRCDILNAFSGLSKVISSEGRSKMLVGLPERLLAQSMLWMYTGSEGPTSNTLGLPTWTWASWHGGRYDPVSPIPCSNEVIQGFHGPQSHAHFGTLLTIFYNDPNRSLQKGLRPTAEDRIWFKDAALTCLSVNETDSLIISIINDRSSRFTDHTKPEAHVQLWKNCIHGPWEARRHSDLDLKTRIIAEQYPYCLAFNTTVALLHVRPGLPERHQIDSFVHLDLYTSDGKIVGETAQIHVDWARKFDADTSYHVFVVGAGHSGKGFSQDHPFKQDKPWALFVMIASREGRVYSRLAIGVVSLTEWTKLKPKWMPVILI